jgi:hypothetical protein
MLALSTGRAGRRNRRVPSDAPCVPPSSALTNGEALAGLHSGGRAGKDARHHATCFAYPSILCGSPRTILGQSYYMPWSVPRSDKTVFQGGEACVLSEVLLLRYSRSSNS